MNQDQNHYQIKKHNKIKNYGYENDNISVDDQADARIYKRILNLIQKSDFNNYNSSTIIKTILESYKKKIEGNPLEKNEYVLVGHEIKEFDLLEDQHVFRYLTYRYKYKIYPELYMVDNYPPCIQIEPTSICNFRCIMCYQIDKSFSNKSNGFMSSMNINMFKKIIDQLEGNIEAITFASRGEPTLNQALPQMMDYSNNKFLALKLNTNASMLNEKLIHDILSTNFQSIIFSIDSAEKAIYEKIRINGKFEKIISNLELFNKIRKKHYSNSKHIIKCSGVKINDYQNIRDMDDKLKKYADVIALVQYTPWESAYKNDINNLTHPCRELWSRMFIWADGKVNPCDYDYKSYLSKWNINKQKISNIWNSKEYNHYRQLHLTKMRKMIEPCKRCLG